MTEHPDTKRIRAALEVIQQPDHADLPAQVEGWVDPETMEELLGNYLRLDPDVDFLDLRTMRKISAAFAHGFLLGAQFQAAGGHREVAE